MRLRRIGAIALRILAQFIHDGRTLLLMFAAPVLIMSIVGYVFRAQENGIVSVAVVDGDEPSEGRASLSATLIESLTSSGKLAVTHLTVEEAESAVRNGAAKVALVFGNSFTDELWTRRATSLTVILEGSNPAQAGPALAAVSEVLMEGVPTLIKGMLPRALSFLFAAGTPLRIEVRRIYGTESFTSLDFIAPLSIAFLSFFLVFLLTSVSFLRERTHGTMERLAASPVRRFEIVIGYMLGFGLFSMLQATVLVLFTVYVLKITFLGGIFSVLLIAAFVLLGAVNLGIFLSAFARNELQVVQFIPIVIIPQFLLAGLFWPVQDMPRWLQIVARFMPLTWATETLVDIMVRGRSIASEWRGLAVLAGFALVAGLLAGWSIRRDAV